MAMCRSAAVLLAAVALLGFQEQVDLDRWIADLINVDAGVRAKAEKALIKAGQKALAALKQASESKTPELATRAKFVISEIERIEYEKKYDAQQRPRRLEIVTLQIKDAPLADALKALGAHVDSTFHSSLDPKQKLTIDVSNVPLRKCLDQMEDLLKATIVSKMNYHRLSKGAATRKKRAYVPGATFEFSLAKFQKDGNPDGWCLTTDQTGTATVFVDSFEAFDAQKAPVTVELCGRCSPRFVHFKTDKPGPFTVRVKGRLVWENPYDFGIPDPSKPSDSRVGPFVLKYEWPKVAWTSEEPVPQQIVGRADLLAKLKKELQGPGGGGQMGVSVNPPAERFANSWCSCSAGAMPWAPAKPVLVGGGNHFETSLQSRKPDQLESLKLRFFKGIEETFEAEAVVSP